MEFSSILEQSDGPPPRTTARAEWRGFIKGILVSRLWGGHQMEEREEVFPSTCDIPPGTPRNNWCDLAGMLICYSHLGQATSGQTW